MTYFIWQGLHAKQQVFSILNQLNYNKFAVAKPLTALESNRENRNRPVLHSTDLLDGSGIATAGAN